MPFETTTRTPTTKESLLRDLAKDPDSERLDEFARIYEPVLRRYAVQAQRRLRRSLCESDQDDLVQEAFLAVRRAIPQFRYDRSKGRFRNYLSLTVRNLALRFQKAATAVRATAPDAIAELAEEAAGRDGDRTEAEDLDLMRSIWSKAYALVMAGRGYKPNTLAIFRSLAIDGLPANEVAEEFKTNVNAVYQIKDRILRAIRAEIKSATPRGGGLVELNEELFKRVSASGGNPGR